MAREIHYDRSRIDLDLSVSHDVDTVAQLLRTAVPSKHVEIEAFGANQLDARVVSWARLEIGRFEVSWRADGDNTQVQSSLYASVLHSTSWIPFVFGKGDPQAVPAYEESMRSVRKALR